MINCVVLVQGIHRYVLRFKFIVICILFLPVLDQKYNWDNTETLKLASQATTSILTPRKLILDSGAFRSQQRNWIAQWSWHNGYRYYGLMF